MLASPVSLPRLSPEEYLAYEREQPLRHELVDGYLYAMTGAIDRHEEIALNLVAALHAHLRGSHYRVYKGDLKIRIADDFYYPDIFVRCGELRGDAYFKTDPVMVAEVLSPNTQRYDRGDIPVAHGFSGKQSASPGSEDKTQRRVAASLLGEAATQSSGAGGVHCDRKSVCDGYRRLAYVNLPTLQEYVLISQDQMLVEVYSQRETGSCLRLERPDDLLRLESVGFSISLAELYE